MSEKTLIISFFHFFKYVESQYRVLKILTQIKETVKANPNAVFRTYTFAMCFEKFDDIKKFMEFDKQLKNNGEKFSELVCII